jgi:hypothetical protein
MSKFFLFKSADVNPTSNFKSDSGFGVDIVGIPSSNLSFLSAKKGEVVFVFDNAGLYEDTHLADGESLEKTDVTVSCVEGQEQDLIESVIKFITTESSGALLRFDATSSSNTFNPFNNSDKRVSSKVRVNSTNRGSGRVSYQRDANYTSTDSFTIHGVDFRDDSNLPDIDFNPQQLAGYGNNVSITAWSNDPKAKTGGTHSVNAVTGTVRTNKTSTSHFLNEEYTYSAVGTNGFLSLASAYSTPKDYTLYFVLGRVAAGYNSLKIYGNDDGSVFGIGDDKSDQSIIQVRHNGITGSAATVKTDNTDNGSSSYSFPVETASQILPDKGQSCYVFVIRRDKDFNIFVYNHKGDYIAFIPAKVRDTFAITASTPNRTDGELEITQLGSSGSDTTNSFGGVLARFGVIPRDVGNEHASSIAAQLFNQYKP